jgi:hypothetical protein
MAQPHSLLLLSQVVYSDSFAFTTADNNHSIAQSLIAPGNPQCNSVTKLQTFTTGPSSALHLVSVHFDSISSSHEDVTDFFNGG